MAADQAVGQATGLLWTCRLAREAMTKAVLATATLSQCRLQCLHQLKLLMVNKPVTVNKLLRMTKAATAAITVPLKLLTATALLHQPMIKATARLADAPPGNMSAKAQAQAFRYAATARGSSKRAALEQLASRPTAALSVPRSRLAATTNRGDGQVCIVTLSHSFIHSPFNWISGLATALLRCMLRPRIRSLFDYPQHTTISSISLALALSLSLFIRSCEA